MLAAKVVSILVRSHPVKDFDAKGRTGGLLHESLFDAVTQGKLFHISHYF